MFELLHGLYNNNDQHFIIETTMTVPTVITKELLIDLVIRQGPQYEAGIFFQEDGIKLEKIEEIRIEHCRVLHISHLWIMTGLTKLSLCNNIIEKIDNLQALVNLKELDLSFNHIEIIENLDSLNNLEILCLYSNKISELSGISHLQKLQIFSIGNNLLNDWDHVLYLRKLKSLRSLNTNGNPCTEKDGYLNYVIAFIPQLIYLRYKMISIKQHKLAVEKYNREILALEDAEAIENENLQAQILSNERSIVLQDAYVEGLDENGLFQDMFRNDKEGKLFIEISEETNAAYESYKTTFCEICTELINFGLIQQERKVKEIELFSTTLTDEKAKVTKNAQEVTNLMFDKKIEFFNALIKMLSVLKDNTTEYFNTICDEATQLTKDIIITVQQEWTNLMKNEVTLHQQILDAIELFTVVMSDMVNTSVETSRGYFVQLRIAEADYNNNLQKLMTIYINSFGEDLEMPGHLTELCGEKDILHTNLNTSLDMHLQVIDNREDILINRIKTWCSDLFQQLIQDETIRYKSRILEISYILNFENQDLENLNLKGCHYIKNIFSNILHLFDLYELVSFRLSSDKRQV